MVTKHVTDSVATLERGSVPDWINDHLRAYRESGGTVGHYWDSTDFGGDGLKTCLLLTTRGRHTGKTYVHPLLYGADGDRYVIVGSKGGADTHPNWYYNLLATPEAEVQVGPEALRVRATLATGSERTRLWDLMTQVYPPYLDYQSRTTREIPLFSLAPIGGDS